ncbi:MAG: segregation/condensation protein A [Phycisphaerales bacterium]|nr:segregation/condensation protein A [Phycisphaerales bacterium]
MSEMYRVQLDTFEGPMDLLLYLIRKHEVDLHDIPISVITEQYIGFLDDLDRIDIELAGEFLVMASTLMELKSRILAAKLDEKDVDLEVEDAAPGADPRAELVRQLLEYKKFRDAADTLEARRVDWDNRFPVKPAGVDDQRVHAALEDMGELEIEDLDLADLVDAFRQIIAAVDFDRMGQHEVISDDTPIELHAADIVDRLERHITSGLSTHSAMTLRTLVAGRTRAEMVGVFLALLVLVRDQRVGIESENSEILLELREVDEDAELAIMDEFD